MERDSRHRPRPARTEALTALVGLVLTGSILLYQVWDFRTAFTAFDEWWVFFGPSSAGDDFIAVTLDAEHVEDLHRYYRSIAVVTGARRMADGPVARIRAPEHLYLLWTLDPDDLGDFDRPGFRDTALENWSSDRVVWVDYDPVVSETTIASWRQSAVMTGLAWNVVAVDPGDRPDSFVLYVDEARETVYVVPDALAPATGGAR